MALNALTLSTTSGVQGRSFEATINGLTTGDVEVLVDGTPGFYTVNGKLYSDELPLFVNTVVLREREPGVGAGYRDTRIDITGYSIDNPAPQPPADGSALITDGQSLAITNSAGADPHNATVAITGNDIDSIKLAATVAMVDNAETAPVQNSAGATIGTGTVTVANGAVSNIRLPATVAGVSNAGTVAVRNSAGADSHNATAVVAAGALTGVNLAATVALVDNGDALTVPVTGTYTTTATITVANGVITGIELS